MLSASASSKALTVMAFAAVAVLLAACGSSGGGTAGGSGTGTQTGSGSVAEGGSGPTPEVAFLSYNDNEYTQVWEEGLEVALKPVGGNFQYFSAAFDPQKQQAQCEDAITSGRYNAVLLAAASGSTAAPCVSLAAAQGLPVVALDTPAGPNPNSIDPQLEGIVGSVVNTGQKQGELEWPVIQKACEGVDPCEVIMEIANRVDPFSSSKLKYIEEQADKTAGKVKIVSVLQGNYESAQTAANIPDALTANPKVKVVDVEADNNAVVAVKAIKEAGLKGVNVIGYGGSREGAEAVESGEIFATFGDFPKKAAETAGAMIIDTLDGKEIKEPGVFTRSLGKPAVVYKSNVGEFTPEWPAK